jgi:16S rRNA (uracil1498-N3)-methyltransferase
MHRFYLPPNQTRGDSLVLKDEEAHHALNVLRLQPGERVAVLDGAGVELMCEFRGGSRHEAQLVVRQRNTLPPLAAKITLLQAVPKGRNMDLIVQKATELGAARIVPILSERVVSHLDEEGAQHKGEKWQHVAIEAIKQCGSAWLPRVEAPVSMKEFLGRNERFELPLIASLQPDRRHPREVFRGFVSEHRRHPRSICIWVGPEGDFTPAEVAAAKSAGAMPITLGPLVLRTETAAVYCLSILNYELQCPPGEG